MEATLKDKWRKYCETRGLKRRGPTANEYSREIKRFRWKFEPEYRLQEIERRKVYRDRYRHTERARARAKYSTEKARLAKRRLYLKNPELCKAKARKYYAANREDQRTKAYERRNKKHPARGLVAAIASFESGKLKLDELTERLGKTLAQIDDRINAERRK